MGGKKGRSGRPKSTLYAKAYWISLSPRDSDLLPFFKQLDQLPRDQRNTALLAAIRGGTAAGQAAMEKHSESRKASVRLDALVNDL